MTATRMRQLGGLATLAVLAALWLLAASLLWRTSVPHDLRLPSLDAADFFSQEQLRRSAHFERLLRWNLVAGTLVQLAALAAVAAYGPRIARTWAVGPIGRGVLVAGFAVTVLWALALPFDLASLWWSRRYGIDRTGYVEWALGSWGALSGIAAGTALFVAVLMAMVVWLRWAWWLAAGTILLGLAVGITFVMPLLAFDNHPVRNPQLRRDISRIERIEGVEGTKVEVEKVREQTTAANAYTYGIGPTERVVLWDTLLDGRFTEPQVAVVVAHELGHVRSRHILKGIGWAALIVFPELFVLGLVVRRRGGLRDPGAIPFALLVLALLDLAILPAFNVVSRRYEAEADWRALQATRDPPAARDLFRAFSTTSLQQPDPPGWDYVMFEDHPTLMQRLAMVRAWQAREGR